MSEALPTQQPMMRASPSFLDVQYTSNATFTVSIGGKLWLESAPISFFAEGSRQRLERIGGQKYSGSDRIGTYSCVNVTWSWSRRKLPLHTSLKFYDAHDTAVFVLQTDKASRKWPADDKFEHALRTAFAECTPSEQAVVSKHW